MTKNKEKVTLFGFGAQGKAQALNLIDSGVTVNVHLRAKSPKINEAKDADIPVITDAKKAASSANTAVLLIPDSAQPEFYKKYMAPFLPKNAAMIFAHGFCVHYRQIIPRPDLDVILVAPLMQGDTVRSAYLNGSGVPCLISVAQDATGKAKERAFDFAKAISQKGPFIKTTFAEEVETDLFIEQSLLCGGLPELVKGTFDTLVNDGYSEDIAYLCCVRELGAIVSVMEKAGLAGLRKKISDTAGYGALTRGPRIISKRTRMELKKILGEIRTGKFANELIKNRKNIGKILEKAYKAEKRHLIEKVHCKFKNSC